MDKFLKEYTAYLKNKNLSLNTIESYIRDLNSFFDFLESHNYALDEIDEMVLMSYVQGMMHEKKAENSILRGIAAVRSFTKFLLINNEISYNPFIKYNTPKYAKELPEILTVAEVEKLLSIPVEDSFKGSRDKTMLEILYATGMKVTELLNLTLEDINLKMQYIRCRDSKGIERIVPFGSFAAKCIIEYLKFRVEINVNSSNIFFLTFKGETMSRQNFWKIIKHYADKADIKKTINSYTLRHSFAVHLLENGADIRTVQELLGHRDMSITQAYLKIMKKNKISEIYRSSHPRA